MYNIVRLGVAITDRQLVCETATSITRHGDPTMCSSLGYSIEALSTTHYVRLPASGTLGTSHQALCNKARLSLTSPRWLAFHAYNNLAATGLRPEENLEIINNVQVLTKPSTSLAWLPYIVSGNNQSPADHKHTSHTDQALTETIQITLPFRLPSSSLPGKPTHSTKIIRVSRLCQYIRHTQYSESTHTRRDSAIRHKDQINQDLHAKTHTLVPRRWPSWLSQDNILIKVHQNTAAPIPAQALTKFRHAARYGSICRAI